MLVWIIFEPNIINMFVNYTLPVNDFRVLILRITFFQGSLEILQTIVKFDARKFSNIFINNSGQRVFMKGIKGAHTLWNFARMNKQKLWIANDQQTVVK